MEGIQTNNARMEIFSCPGQDFFQIADVTNTPIFLGSHPVEAYGNAGGASVALQSRRDIGLVRAYCNTYSLGPQLTSRVYG